jgi:hypothetical protein
MAMVSFDGGTSYYNSEYVTSVALDVNGHPQVAFSHPIYTPGSSTSATIIEYASQTVAAIVAIINAATVPVSINGTLSETSSTTIST